MERPTSTTKYEASPPKSEDLTLHDASLELPDGRDFVPVVNRPRKMPEGFLQVCASFLPQLRSRPDYNERRRRDRCDVAFDFDHPERVPATYDSKLLDELF